MAEFHRDRRRRDGLRPDCKECNRAYNRAYHETHREKCNANQRAYREAHGEEICARDRAYYQAHGEEIRARDRAYREAHREERNAQIRKRTAEIQSASLEVATRNGEPWTQAEDKVVISSDGTVLDIAIELGRTTGSIRNRRELLRRKAVTA